MNDRNKFKSSNYSIKKLSGLSKTEKTAPRKTKYEPQSRVATDANNERKIDIRINVNYSKNNISDYSSSFYNPTRNDSSLSRILSENKEKPAKYEPAETDNIRKKFLDRKTPEYKPHKRNYSNDNFSNNMNISYLTQDKKSTAGSILNTPSYAVQERSVSRTEYGIWLIRKWKVGRQEKQVQGSDKASWNKVQYTGRNQRSPEKRAEEILR